MFPSTRASLDRIVDYAGTFPPASLTLADALAEYARARNSDDAWLLGRFVVPAVNLSDLERRAPGVVPDKSDDRANLWDFSVVLSADSRSQLERVRAFNDAWAGRARIASVEFGPVPLLEIASLARAVPQDLETFFETPLDADLERRLRAIDAAGAAAKIRTGGTAAGSSPTPAGIVHFLETAGDTGVAFKATAGLHHLMRGCYPLTHDAGSGTEPMHGFLNLAVAASLVRTDRPQQDVLDALLESSVDAFEFHSDGLCWRGRTVATADLADTRRRFFRSFGSCAFREPADELRRLRCL
ncbi:MAG TPA: hypothetical protein VGZ27_03180 [Vicinamibacterales bacterium]|jgi:hypothetical protein|nr:hypothetical protein [Vicinamibacterales bacterium]